MKRSAPRTLVLLFLAFALATTFRAGSMLATPELRAEDATVFFQDASQLGMAAIFHEHNGYHHLLPRLLAALGSLQIGLLDPIALIYRSFTVGVLPGLDRIGLPVQRHVHQL